MKRRLVLFGEGTGDKSGGYWLTKNPLTELAAWDHFSFAEKDCLKAGDLGGLLKDHCAKWRTLLRHAQRKSNLGGVLLLLDGDSDKKVLREAFCAKTHATTLAIAARDVGAGSFYSAAVVFACREFESWLIAGVASLAGVELTNGLPGIKAGTYPPDVDLEQSIRGAKEWLGQHMTQPYKPPLHQAEFARRVSFHEIRNRRMRSFGRLEKAIKEIVEACRTGRHVSTPASR